MDQEVEISVKLTFSAHVSLTRRQLGKKARELVAKGAGRMKAGEHLVLMNSRVTKIREEAEIYGNG